MLSCFACACGSSTDADRFAGLLGVKQGSVVADVGAGKGDLALAMAERVGPDGRVYATEIDPDLVAKIRERVASQEVTDLEVVEASETATGLPVNCCDAIFMRGVYHHLTDPKDTDQSLYTALRPGGEILIQDFRPNIWLSPWIPKGIPANRGGHGVAPAIVVDEMTTAGFQHVETIEPWTSSWFFSNYAVLFRKPDDRSSPSTSQ